MFFDFSVVTFENNVTIYAVFDFEIIMIDCCNNSFFSAKELGFVDFFPIPTTSNSSGDIPTKFNDVQPNEAAGLIVILPIGN